MRQELVRIFDDNNSWDMDRILIEALKVMNNMIGQSGFSANQAVFGHGISDPASTLLGEEKRSELLQDCNPYGPFVQAMKLREAAVYHMQVALNEQRIRRLLKHHNKYKQVDLRVGDVVCFYKEKNENL